MYDLTALEVEGTRITPIEVTPSGGTSKITVRVIGPTGKAVKRARTFRGEMAHADADRYMGDVALELRHSSRTS